MATGEIVAHEHETKRKISSEPDFIKVYYKSMMATLDINQIPLKFLLALSGQINYANDGDKVFFIIIKRHDALLVTNVDVGITG